MLLLEELCIFVFRLIFGYSFWYITSTFLTVQTCGRYQRQIFQVAKASWQKADTEIQQSGNPTIQRSDDDDLQFDAGRKAVWQGGRVAQWPGCRLQATGSRVAGGDRQFNIQIFALRRGGATSSEYRNDTQEKNQAEESGVARLELQLAAFSWSWRRSRRCCCH